MYPNLSDYYLMLMHREREKELLRLLEEKELLRNVEAVNNSFPRVILKRLLSIFNRLRSSKRMTQPISLQGTVDSNSTRKVVQCQTC